MSAPNLSTSRSAEPAYRAGRVVYEALRGTSRFVVLADFYPDGTWRFARAEGDDGSWNPFDPSAEEVADGQRRLVEQQQARAATARAAGHVLARAALEAFSAAASAAASSGAPAGRAYALFNADEHASANSESVRIQLICEKLTLLLKGNAPQAPPQEVQRVAQEQLNHSAVAPSARVAGAGSSAGAGAAGAADDHSTGSSSPLEPEVGKTA
jgi:hypothetical protein